MIVEYSQPNIAKKMHVGHMRTTIIGAALANAGAQIVSYIPNNAYLVQLSADGAARLRGNAEVAAVLPFEPYFKLQASLLGLAVAQKPLPPGQVLTLGLFDLSANQTLTQIENLGGVILASDRSPFGPIVRVRPPADWIALAQLPGVQRVEPATRRVVANDLARVTMGITTDYYATNANWRGLSGTNVVVEVNDTGIDASHPDFSTTGYAGAPGANPPTRVSGDTANSVVDTDGHGTFVAGEIAGARTAIAELGPRLDALGARIDALQRSAATTDQLAAARAEQAATTALLAATNDKIAAASEKISQAGKQVGDLADRVNTPRARVQALIDGFAIYFDGLKPSPRPGMDERLDALAAALKDTGLGIRIVGHTDETGSRTRNQEISKKRADAAADLLADRGVARDKIVTVGRAYEAPAQSMARGVGELNRRAVFELPYEGEVSP